MREAKPALAYSLSKKARTANSIDKMKNRVGTLLIANRKIAG
jgi:hypothetical protein